MRKSAFARRPVGPGRHRPARNRALRGRWLLAVALVASLAGAMLLGRSAPPAQAAHCAIVPVVRGAMLVDQGLASYANSPLIRGHDTLVKVTLSQPQTRPSCAATTASAYLTGGTLTVTTGGTTLTTTPVEPTGFPVTTFPLIAPYATTPPINSTGDPIFRIPASALAAPALTGRYTATITANITYESKSSTAAAPIAGHNPVTATRNVTVEAPTNGWKLLVIPMGVRGQPDQFSEGALGAVASGMQTLSRLSGVPKGTESGTAALGESTGGVRYTVNQGDLVDVSGLLVDAAGVATSDVLTGKFCGKATNFAAIEAQLGQFLQVWNLANRTLAADKAVGVSDELRSKGGAGCAEGMARVGSNTAWVRAMHVAGSPVRTGALLGMEGMHMLGGVPLARDDNFSPNHSAKTPADGAVGDANTGFNVASGLFLGDDRSVMKLSSQTAWLDANTLYEPLDLQYSLCAFGGTATTECKTAVPTPLGATPSAADLIESFVMSGTTADTEPTTHLIESYATSMLPGTLDADGPYFLEYRDDLGNPIGPRFGVPVFEVQSHHDEDTGDSGTPTDRVFSGAIPFPAAAQADAETIVFYKQTGPSTRVTLFTLVQDGEAPVIVVDPTTTGGGGGANGTTTLGSGVDPDVEADDPSFFPALSADGNFLVFYSGATNLVDGHDGEVYVRDLETGELEGIDVALEGSGSGGNPSISGDGRYVVFQSSSSFLVEGDGNGEVDIFVRDRELGETTLVSVTGSGAQGDGDSFFPDISDDGRYVAFHSTSTNFAVGDTNGTFDVFVKDLQTGDLEFVSDSGDGPGNAFSQSPSISGDGRFVAFESAATNLVPDDTNAAIDIFVRNRVNDTTVRASFVDDVDADIEGNGNSRHPAISSDGAHVAFDSDATNFSDLDDNGQTDVYVSRVLEGQGIDLVSLTPADAPFTPAGLAADGASHTFGPSAISDNGRFIMFASSGTNLIGGDSNEQRDVFVRDRVRRETIRASVTDAEAEANGDSGSDGSISPMSISGDGGRVAFLSTASNLPSFETSGTQQAFVREEAPPPDACSIDQAASTTSVTGSTIEFVNLTSRTVDIYWLDFNGHRVRYNTLDPEQGYTQATWITHPWVAVDHVTGRCYGWVLSDVASKTFEIAESSGGGEGEQQLEATVTDGEQVQADILLACPVSGEQVENHVVAVGVDAVETSEGGEASFVVPTTASCPGGEFKIAFNDGVNTTGFIDAGPPVLQADPEPPVAAITSPAQGQEFLSSRFIGAWGSGRSEEFGELSGGALDWTVRNAANAVVDTESGAAPTFVLGEGTYTLELTATDADGRSTTVSRSITVLQDADKDGIPRGQETLACVAAGATGAPDLDPLNAYKDGDRDGLLNIDEVSMGTAPCVQQATYTGISIFVPTTIDLDSTDRTFSAQAMRVDYVDMRRVNRTTVRIVSLAGFDVSTNDAFRNTGFIAYKEYAAATFNRQAIIAFLKANDIPRQGDFEQVEIVVSGQGSTPISGQPNHNWTFITPGTVRVQK